MRNAQAIDDRFALGTVAIPAIVDLKRWATGDLTHPLGQRTAQTCAIAAAIEPSMAGDELLVTHHIR